MVIPLILAIGQLYINCTNGHFAVQNTNFKGKVLPAAYVIVEVVKVQKLMMEFRNLQSRYTQLFEDWEKIGYWIIERELLEKMVKKLTKDDNQTLE